MRTASILTLILTLALTGSGHAQPNLIPDDDIQTSGPVHEAFAQPFDLQPEPGQIVPKQPPEPIPELPPEERPEGNDYNWIPGYWAWDSERGDFLWISGTYRRTPADRQYVPGYWTEATDGWRWVAGYWAAASQPELQYTPEPPAPLEQGPTVAGPEDSVYVPGYWNYQNTRFAWRPGYYATGYQDRIWIAPTYRWTPAGYVFVNGYWDYPIADRGVLFAPVYFNQPYWRTPGWNYRPWYSVGLGGLLDCLFYRPSYGHYYFGNYFGGNYARAGYRPWYNAAHSPYTNYYRWQNRGNPNWYANVQGNYNARSAGRMAVPPRTLAQQNVALKNINNSNISITQIVGPFNKNQQNVRLTKGNNIDIQKKSIARTQELAQVRRQFESKTLAPRVGTEARTLKLPAGNPIVRESRNDTKPPHVVGRPDNGVRSPGNNAPKINKPIDRPDNNPRTLPAPGNNGPRINKDNTPNKPPVIRTPGNNPPPNVQRPVDRTPNNKPANVTPNIKKPVDSTPNRPPVVRSPANNNAPKVQTPVDRTPANRPPAIRSPEPRPAAPRTVEPARSQPRAAPAAPRVQPPAARPPAQRAPARVSGSSSAPRATAAPQARSRPAPAASRPAPAKSAPSKSGGGKRR